MNRTAALTEVAAWKLIIADTSSKTVERNAVRALVAAAEWWQTEAERLAEQTPAQPLVRPATPDTPQPPAELPRRSA